MGRRRGSDLFEVCVEGRRGGMKMCVEGRGGVKLCVEGSGKGGGPAYLMCVLLGD